MCYHYTNAANFVGTQLAGRRCGWLLTYTAALPEGSRYHAASAYRSMTRLGSLPHTPAPEPTTELFSPAPVRRSHPFIFTRPVPANK